MSYLALLIVGGMGKVKIRTLTHQRVRHPGSDAVWRTARNGCATVGGIGKSQNPHPHTPKDAAPRIGFGVAHSQKWLCHYMCLTL